jgi:AraC-like DNA-binding protein
MKRASRFSVQRGWRLLITDLGLQPADVLAMAALPGDLFSRADATLTPADYFALWRGLEAAAGDLELPLAIARALSVEVFEPPIFASLCSPNLNVALQRLSEFKRLIGPMHLLLNVTPDSTTVELSCYGYSDALPSALCTTELVFFTQLARLATRQAIVPLAVTLVQPPRQADVYQDFFGVPVSAGTSNRIRFGAADAVRPFLTEDVQMWGFFASNLRQRLSMLDTEAGIAERVRVALLQMLPCGQGSIEAVASHLAMSKRSLQRALSAEAANFQSILGTTRTELAQHYLSNSTLSSGEIAFLLGFKDGNSFIRAFTTWTGISPIRYRQAS